MIATKEGMVMRGALKKLALVFLLLSVFLFQAPASYGEPISGSFEVGVPPWGPPDYDFLFYGLDNISLSGDTVTITSNNNLWGSNAWPGLVLDKIFFAPASATTGGIFTADVEISIGGNSFAAVINPDLGSLLPPGSINTSGTFTGDLSQPDTFSFSGLPVYAIVPYDANFLVDLPVDFMAWDYGSLLYANNEFYNDNARLYSLAQVGTLSLEAENGSYHLTSGSTTGYIGGSASVPEPSTMLLLGSGLLGLVGLRRKFKK
jgi:hypothetical protein